MCPFTEGLRQFKDPPVTSEQANHHWSFLKSLDQRIAEAQQRYDMAKPGEAVSIDHDLMPHINRTDKCVVIFSDEVMDFPKTEK